MIRRVLACCVTTATIGLFTFAWAAPAQSQSESVQRSNYIVTFKSSVGDPAGLADEQARRHDGAVKSVYRHALKGYSATLPDSAVARLRSDPRVASVEPDQVATITGQTVPTGVQRIFADDNVDLDIDGVDDVRTDVDIAILDTGIDHDHPDLNVVGRTNCGYGFTGCNDNDSESAMDDNHGHGTHVAGSAAAIDNGSGVVGVAPGARLWSVKVLNDAGSGPLSDIAEGLDWVAARSTTIEVVNLSLGCECAGDTALSTAIANLVDKGVVVVVAAGNNGKDASSFFPASHPDVITVSALADFNGAPGGGAASTCRAETDDTLADFSNFGSTVEIAAPGTCIYSTTLDGGYSTLSGTSMASPHVAGAAGYYASLKNPGSRADVLKIRDDLVFSGNSGWTDDSGDSAKEPLLDVAAPSDPTQPRARFAATCGPTTCTFDASGSTDDGTVTSYAWKFGDGSTGSGKTASHTYAPDKVYTVTLTVTDNTGKTDETSQGIVVGNPPPTASFTSSCSSPRVCTFDASVSADPGGSVSSYAWTFGDGTTGTGKVLSHTYPAPGGGTYTVKLTVTDNQGKTATTTKTITPPPNQLPVPVVSVGSCLASVHGCYLNGYATSDPDGGLASTFTYVWDFGDGTTTTGVSVFHGYPAAGTYTVKLTVTDDEGTSAATTRSVVAP
ncbi:PKD domain-containing protein [Streptomyces sp. A3M-1-3]|uniref:PKD domain-containing protein n=1 Tax=Streptomyces sp. A3M-1-3 TaxID=2962044 RepID=UPI0020B89BAF|nr:PKD domain-containing protein [Streptomyces sp. A3M-1-3]MCP3820397.1 PKD domain-containing protein [Streptomyces sp. A3M-1-3]